MIFYLFFSICEPWVILTMYNNCSLMYYFQKRMGVGVVMSLYIHTAFLFVKEIRVFYIVMMNPTWVSDGMLKFSNLNTQECLRGDSTVLYPLTLNACGSGGQLQAPFPPSPKPLVNVKRVLHGETCLIPDVREK